MKVELYNVEISELAGSYSYYEEYTKRYNKAKKLVAEHNLAIELAPEEYPPVLIEGEVEQYESRKIATSSTTLVLTDNQIVKLAVAGIQFKVLHPIFVELEDISLPFRTIEGKSGEHIGSATNNTYNNKCEVHMPGNMMASYNELMLVEDSCTDVIQTHLSSGWRLIAVQPQPDQRRPDYILGRFNPNKQVDDGAVRG